MSKRFIYMFFILVIFMGSLIILTSYTGISTGHVVCRTYKNLSNGGCTCNMTVEHLQKLNNISLEDSVLEELASKSLQSKIAESNSDEKHQRLTLCPETPPNLAGNLKITENLSLEEVTDLESLKRVKFGGRYRPPDCKAREQVAIIIPYRDRKHDLDIQLRLLHKVLQRQQCDYMIFVVEMVAFLMQQASMTWIFVLSDFNKQRSPKERIKLRTIPISELASEMIWDEFHTITITCTRTGKSIMVTISKYALPTSFNKGLINNAGFTTAMMITNFSCVIFHDVDSFMMNDRNLYRCGSEPRHYLAYSTKYGDKGLPHPELYGGVVGFTPDQFTKVNGFSNLYFGWGEEDNDLTIRVKHAGLKYIRSSKDVGGYMGFKHHHDKTNPEGSAYGLIRNAKARVTVEGVGTIRFRRYAVEYRELYTWILIGVDQPEITQKYQQYFDYPMKT